MSSPWKGPKAPPSDTKGPGLLIAYGVMAGISGIILILRVVARIQHRGKLFWDDYLMILSYVRSSDIHGQQFQQHDAL